MKIFGKAGPKVSNPLKTDIGSNDVEMKYELRLSETEAGTGYFSCVPESVVDFESGLEFLKNHPYDQFMRKHLLAHMAEWPEEKIRNLVRVTMPEEGVHRSLLLEACLLNDAFEKLRSAFSESEVHSLSRLSPLTYIRSHRLPDQPIHRRWIELFRRNIQEHQPLPPPRKVDLDRPCSDADISRIKTDTVSIESIFPDFLPLKEVLFESEEAKPALPAPADTARIALERLADIGVIAGEEMRHNASLSPIALLRKWRVNIQLRLGRHRYRLTGKQTAYGRGLELDHARAAYAMEMVERCSAFASIGPEGVIGYQAPYPLIQGRFSELEDRNIPALNPDHLALQAPYEDEPLYWLEGTTPGPAGPEPILVPVQCVFLFSNLDEIALFSGLGSTGLASGNTMAQAKVNALLEIIERHCEGVTPFATDRCFDLETTEPRLAKLLLNYLENGIRVQFQDITSPLGIPCCKCFVMDAAGGIIRGTGAHLNAGLALISAMTETPYPFPGGPPASSGLTGLLRVPFEKLPDFTTGSPETDLALLEQLLAANGYRPVYVDLTRRDLALPVVRAMIPGMEITPDFDRFSRVHPRLFANYIEIY